MWSKQKIRNILIFLMILELKVYAQYYSGEGPTVNINGCFTPDYTQGLCVPMTKCRRIEWLLRSWSPPYPAHIARYVRQSHCGSQEDVHYVCCAFYDIKDHRHYSHQPPKIPKPYPSPTFIRNPHDIYQGSNRPLNSHMFSSDPLDFHEMPTLNYLRHSKGESILRSTPCGNINIESISDGEIVRLSEFPWMALLESEGVKKSRQRFRCAGTLVSNQYVLTAAHCVEDINEVTSVRLGEHDLNHEHDCEDKRKSRQRTTCAPPYEDVAIADIIMHPEYTRNPLQNDIALIRLQRLVEFKSNIKAICLPLDSSIISEIPSEQIAAGWGVTERGYASNALLKAKIPLHSLKICQNAYTKRQLNAEEHICAGGIDRRSTCLADSGGPLFGAVLNEHHQMRYIQFGITTLTGSYGCEGKHIMPSVYTNVGNYINWIMGTIF